MSRTNVANVEPVVTSAKAMNDRTPTSGRNGTRVGQIIRNGSHWSCVGMDQADFGYVKQASIGTSKMDHGMESNDGLKMDQEWYQMFEMMERAELSDFVVKPSLKFERAPSGPLARSKATPNLINQSETVRNYSTSCSHPFTDNTQSYNHSSQRSKVELQSYIKDFKDRDQSGKQTKHSEMQKRRAQELSFGNDHSTSRSHPFKDNTQSFYQSNICVKHTNESHSQSRKKVYGLEMEKSQAQELGFGNNYSTSCSYPFKDNTQSVYPPSSFIKHTNESNTQMNQSRKKV